MKRVLILSLVFLAFATNVFADTQINYGYIAPDFIILNEGENGEVAVMPQPDIIPPVYLQNSGLPEKFDARESGMIRDGELGQGKDGTCWAFASTLCAEAALGGKINLSENHAKYACSTWGGNTYGYDRLPSSGGNFFMYTAYASAWRGPVLESDDPYAFGDAERDYNTVTAAKPVAYHLQGTIEIPNPVTFGQRAAHINEVKKYVYEYGSCFMSMYWSGNNYKSDTKAYYNSNVKTDANHAVTIIGWDDSYPKENFKIQPQNDGAFLVKNSQGVSGFYHYVSYEDAYAGWDAGVVTSIEDRYNYGELYTHEYFEPGAWLTSRDGIAKTTNVFTSRYDGEYVAAVGVVTKSRNLDYEVYLSKNADPLDADESDFTLVASGNLPMPGFHTIKLDEKFLLGNAGTEYQVRVVYKSDQSINIPLEYKTGMIPTTHAKPGESYIIVDNSSFDTGIEYGANVYVKAYTDAQYSVSFDFDSKVKYSINGSAPKSCENHITAGLNDEITLDFSEYNPTGSATFFIINDTCYAANESVTFKVNQDFVISEIKKADVTVSSPGEEITLDACRKALGCYELKLIPQFNREHIVIAIFFKDNKAVGIKSQKAGGNDGFDLTVPVNQTPDSFKIIVINDFADLDTQFGFMKVNLCS